MDHTLFVLFVLNILIYSIKTHSINGNTSLQVTPNWLGTFYTLAECDVQKCCCIYGLITLSKVKPNYLRFQSPYKGSNCPTNGHVDSIITMPTSFKIKLSLMDNEFDISLNDNSNLIKLYNYNSPLCNGSAVRNNGRSIISINKIKMILIIFIVNIIEIKIFFKG